MPIPLSEIIKQLVSNKGISEDLIIETIEKALTAAYKKKFRTDVNVETKVNRETGEFIIYSKKEVVDEVTDDVTEISLEEAREYDNECEIADEIWTEVKPADFDRIAVQTAKNVVLQQLRKGEKEVLYSEYINKKGELISGIYQRERHSNIYISLGKVEGILPRNEQSPREHYEIGERIRALIKDVKKPDRSGLTILLSRSSPNFVRKLFELEVPEILDGTISIVNIVREAGFRTKIAVSSYNNIDPVGACVGVKGIRIQNIVKELEGEKIDVVRYIEDVKEYIKNALSPAKVEKVLILSYEDKASVAVVEDQQLSLAIGKQGSNVKLAAKLTQWNIDVITIEQLEESDYEEETTRAIKDLFSEDDEDKHHISLLELNETTVKKLESVGIIFIEDLLDKKAQDLEDISGIGPKTAEHIIELVRETVEIVDDEEEDEDTEEVEEVEEGEETEEVVEVVDADNIPDGAQVEAVYYQCPDCGTLITEDMTICPGCGGELEFFD